CWSNPFVSLARPVVGDDLTDQTIDKAFHSTLESALVGVADPSLGIWIELPVNADCIEPFRNEALLGMVAIADVLVGLECLFSYHILLVVLMVGSIFPHSSEHITVAVLE